jgi:inner membrane protein
MTRSLTFKILAIGALLVLLLVPLLLLDELVRERQRMKQTAAAEVAQMWGQPQTVAGPLLAVPYRIARTSERDEQSGTVYFLPDSLSYAADLVPHVRTRGIFRVMLYETTVRLEAEFGPLDVAAAGVPAASLLWDQAHLLMGVSDPSGLQQLVAPTWNGQPLETTPGAASPVLSTSLAARLVADRLPLGPDASPVRVTAQVSVRGSESLRVVPLGKSTDVKLRSSWPSPSFVGAFAAREHHVTDGGFAADWRILFLNRGYPQVFTDAGAPQLLGASPDLMMEPAYADRASRPFSGDAQSVGVRLIETADVYQQAERAAEYGFLFVLLTFTTFFFVEVLGRRRIHPLQYLLVGCAVALFYLLLLALAEFIPFGAAYLASATAILGLIALYGRAVLGSWRLSGSVAGLLALFYGYFYVLLQLDAYALLAGSLGLLVLLATVMYLSRSVDWYGVGPAATRSSGRSERADRTATEP